jgi:hypothetical protein
MGSVTIHFEGICTQVKLPVNIGSTLHRVVLVHAENGLSINSIPIPAHDAFLEVDQLDLLEPPLAGVNSFIRQSDGNWQLFGARVSIANAAPGGVTYDPSSFDVPSLTTLTPDFGPLSSTVVFGTAAACHVDISSGTFTASQTPGLAFFTTLVVQTTDDFVVLAVEDMIEGGAGQIRLKSGATIVFTNIGVKTGESDNDFLLHYLTAQNLPADAKVPTFPELVKEVPVASAAADPARAASSGLSRRSRFAAEALGPGCSNSNFP